MQLARKPRKSGVAQIVTLLAVVSTVALWSSTAAAIGFGSHLNFDWITRLQLPSLDDGTHGVGAGGGGSTAVEHRSLTPRNGGGKEHWYGWTGRPGGGDSLTLADLVDGGEGFESGNGELYFDNFSAEAFGIAPERLGRYRIVPTEEGFRILTHLYAIFGQTSELEFDYDVTTLVAGQQIDSAAVSFFGMAIGPGSKAGVGLDLGDAGELAAGVHWGEGRSRRSQGKVSDEILFAESVSELAVSEVIGAASEWRGIFRLGGFSKALMADHSFGTSSGGGSDVSIDPIPEPGTAVLLGFGLVGLGVLGRRR